MHHAFTLSPISMARLVSKLTHCRSLSATNILIQIAAVALYILIRVWVCIVILFLIASHPRDPCNEALNAWNEINES